MTESVYAPPKANLTQGAATGGAYYVVSQTKMMVLFLTTLGAYQLYWHYKNWRLHQEMALSQGGPDGDIWPIPRAIFSFFFVHSLFGKMEQFANENDIAFDFDSAVTATLMVVMMLFGMTSFFTNDPKIVLMISAATLVLLAPLLFMYRKAQSFVNHISGDPDGNSNSEFTGANYFWIVFGILIWIVQLTSLVMISKLS